MTREEAIEYLKQDIEGDLNGRVNIAKKTLKKILDAFNDEPTDDIPIGAPCEITTYIDDRKQLVYYMGDGYFAVTRDEDEYYHGHLKADARPLTIWDIPNEFGGPPPWAIARAYDEYESIWCSNGGDIDSNKDCGYTIERRPEEE
jgi:hypothetical protein